jgi:hypothetical protein
MDTAVHEAASGLRRGSFSEHAWNQRCELIDIAPVRQKVDNALIFHNAAQRRRVHVDCLVLRRDLNPLGDLTLAAENARATWAGSGWKR